VDWLRLPGDCCCRSFRFHNPGEQVMAMFSGPQGPQSKYGRPNKGVMRSYREIKRLEAEDRAKKYKQKRTDSIDATAGAEVS